MPFVFNFPEIKIPENQTITAQADKVREELDELTAAIIFETRMLATMECVDVLIASESLYRTMVKVLGQEYVDKAVAAVLVRCEERDYFVEQSQ